MSYEKTTWATGDVVTAEKLNNLEEGVANADGVSEVITASLCVKENMLISSNSQATLSSDNAHLVAYVEGEQVEIDHTTGIFVPFYVLNDSNGFTVLNDGGFYNDDFYFGVYNNNNNELTLSYADVIMGGTFYKLGR